MGRPKDEFVWLHVVEGSEKDARKCKHCGKEFRKASATRMIKHLAGLGNDISACAAVHPTVREAAAKRFQILKQQRKGRISSVQEQTEVVGDAGPSNIQLNAKKAIDPAAVVPALTDREREAGGGGKRKRKRKRKRKGRIPAAGPSNIQLNTMQAIDPAAVEPALTDTTPAVTNMNINHVREDGEMLIAATDGSLGPAAVHPTVREEAAKRILGSKGKRKRKGRISSVQEQTAIDNPTVGAAGPSNIQLNTTQATVAAVEPALTDTTDVRIIRVLEDNDPYFLPGPAPVFQENASNAEEPAVDRRAGDNSNSLNQYMLTQLTPLTSLGSINRLLTPSATRAISGSMARARLEPPSGSGPIQVDADNGEASSAPNDVDMAPIKVTADNGEASSAPPRKDPSSQASARGHNNTLVQVPSVCTSNTVDVAEAFMKLLLLNSSSSVNTVITDFLKGPYVREFLESAIERGVPSGLTVDNSNVVRNSVHNISEQVYQNTLMLKESWKSTGCTMMVYRKNYSTAVVGFYCPKGVVFMEAPHPEKDLDGFESALKRQSPSLFFNDQTNYFILHHGPDTIHFDELLEESYNIHMEYNQCLRDEIEEIWIDSCTESDWAQSLIKQAVEFHEKICSVRSLRELYYKILEKDGKIFQDFEITKGMSAFRLSIFLSIMRQRRAIEEELLLKHKGDKDLEEYSKLWDEGLHLEEVLKYTLNIPDLMDTLVPTNGYLAMAIKKVDSWLSCILSSRFKALTFWKEVESKLRGTIEGSRMWNAANYLNPVYFLLPEVQQDPQLHQKVTMALINYTNDYNKDENPDALEILEEVERYGDVFRKLFADNEELKYSQHPLKLWEEHGKELPKLRSYAIKLLSQPLNCMCRQVKKHMKELEGAEDYILRLNLRMMHEFKLLGDDINKPLDLY